MADLRQLIPATPKRRTYGSYVVDCCPWHGDTKPSLLIWAGYYRCKACDAHGNTYQGQRGRKEDAADYKPGPRPPVEPLPFEMAFDYHADLTPEKRAYYHARGISDESIDRFLLGYGCPPGSSTPRYAIPIIEGHDLLNIKFRADPAIESGDGVVKYHGIKDHNVPHLWGANGLENAREAILVGGELDRIVSYQELYPDIHPLTGTGGERTWLPEWSQRLHHLEKLYVALDADQAGRAAQDKLCRMLRADGIFPVPVELPKKDPTDCVLAHGAGTMRALLPTHRQIWLSVLAAMNEKLFV